MLMVDGNKEFFMNILLFKVTIPYMQSEHVSGKHWLWETIQACEYRHLSGRYKNRCRNSSMGEGRRGSILINWNKPVEKYLCVIFGTGILSNANLSRARKTGLYGWKVKRKWERELSTAMTTELFKVRRTQATNIKTLKIINSCNLFSSKMFCFVITSHAMQLQFSYAYSLFVLRENNFLSISLLIFK